MNSTTQKVPMGQKIAFGVGMLANQMFPAVLGIFMVVIIEDLGFPGWMFGILQFGPRILDAVTDPLMGFISDNTRSKWGRRRQYVFIGAIMMGLGFIIMWQINKEASVNYNFTYFLLWSLVFYIGITIFSVPYVAMGYEMSDDFHERTSIMAIAQWIGQWAWVIAPWFWVIMYDQSWFASGDAAVRDLAIWVGIVCTLMAMVPAIFIKSESTVDRDDYAPLTFDNIGGSLREIFGNFSEAFRIPSFRKLCIATFLVYNAFMTVAQFSFFIIIYYLFDGDTEAANAGFWPTLFGCVGALVTTFLVIPIVAKMSHVMGKKRAFLASQAISIFGYILFWFLFIPGKPAMFFIALPFFSFGIGSLFTLMMSMTADVIDLDELNTGKRREGVFGAIYWWMVKVGFAIAGGLTGVIFSVIGFESGAEQQTAEAITGLRVFFSGLPIVGTLFAIYVMRNYSISEEKAGEIRAQLDARKNKVVSSSAYGHHKLNTLLTPGMAIGPYTEVDTRNQSSQEIKDAFQAAIQRGMDGLCFSPYVENQNIGDQLSLEQIDRRISIVSDYTKYIRSFSVTTGNELIPQSAKNRGLKTMVGAWISGDLKQNEIEINNLIDLAQKGLVDIAVVGNEVLLRNELSEQQIIGYIERVKKEIGSVPVGYVDAYYQFLDKPNLIDACDIVLINCYPFWEGYDIHDSLLKLRQMYAVTQAAAQGKKIAIAETGWPNQGEANKDAVPSDRNAMQYFTKVQAWAEAEDIDVVYFSSFDESWKVHHEGDVGARWGLWNKNEELKY